MDYVVDIEQELDTIVKNRANYAHAQFDKQRGIYSIQVVPRVVASANSGIEYHVFNKGAYNRTRTQHLIDRGESLIEALMADLKEDLPVTKDIIKQLELEKDKLNYFVKKTKIEVPFKKPAVLSLDIDFERSQSKLTQTDKDIYIKAAIKETDKYIGNMLQRIVASIKLPAESNFAALQRIKEIEIQYRSQQGRPAYLSQFTIPEHQTLLRKPITLVSMQKPIGHYTDKQLYQLQQQEVFPTSRDYTHTSKNRGSEGVANFIESAWGHFDQSSQEFKVDGSLLRGSWIPIDIKDTIRRRAIGLRALEQEFEYLANKAFSHAAPDELAGYLAANAKDNPLVVPLSSMQLLSLLGRLDALDPDHQFKIAQDNHLIMGMVRSQPFEVTLRNGQKVFVKADINEMAMGVNANRYERVAHPLQAEINHRGFNQWISTVYDALLQRAIHLEESAAVNQIRDLIRQDWKLSELKQEIQAAEEKLNGLYARLKQAQARYEVDSAQPEYKREYNKLLAAIETAETRLDKLQQRLLAERKKQWQQHDTKREGLIAELQKECAQLTTVSEDVVDQKARRKEFLDLISLLSDAEELFHTKRYYAQNPEDNYALQARYIIINQYLNRNPHASCKSSEDRTGELENRIMEIQAVKAVSGGYPRSHSGLQDKKLQATSKYIGRTIHEFAASTKNTEFNARGAGGLQLHDKSSWWQKLIFGGKGDGNGYKNNKEALLLAKREKVFFKESLVTKILRKVLPFITPKTATMTWSMWFDDVKLKAASILSRQQQINNPEERVNLNRYQEVPTAKYFEDELARALNGKPLAKDHQQKIANLSGSLNNYHQLIASAQNKTADVDEYWHKLVDLRNSFGSSLLPLCDEEAMLRMDKQQKEKHDQIYSIILVVEKLYHKITHLKNQVEKELNLLGQSTKTIENFSSIFADKAKKGLSFDEVLQGLHSKSADKPATRKDKSKPNLIRNP